MWHKKLWGHQLFLLAMLRYFSQFISECLHNTIEWLFIFMLNLVLWNIESYCCYFWKKFFFFWLLPSLPPQKKTGFSDSILIKIALQMLYMCTYLLYLKKKKKYKPICWTVPNISRSGKSWSSPAPPFIL